MKPRSYATQQAKRLFDFLTASEFPTSGISLAITLRSKYLNNSAPTWYLHRDFVTIDAFQILHLADSQSRQRMDLAALQQDDGFKTLDSKVQILIVSLGEQRRSYRELSNLIREEHKSAKEHVTGEFHQQRKDGEKDEYCRKYLESLAFPGMRARQEIIIDPYSETFQWIFDESGKAVRPWGNFVEWLKNGQSIYWIEGKAGSGKSTLMSYIYEDQRTEASLKTWAGAHELLIVPFFFWKAGNDSPMQKTSAGLLRSLLYQILEKLPDLILSLARNHKDPQGFQTGVHGFPSIPAWTEKRLLMIFRKLLSDLSSTHHLCLFIDGLDEIDGNQNDLVELLQDRVRGPNMKMCLSSRPDRCFMDAFSSPAMLKLEDLTRKDIELYVSSKLQRACRMETLAIIHERWVSGMTTEIVRKARGVFQWVHIVVGYQIQGLQSKDNLEELWERLEELPEEIEELYAYMLKKIDKVHRKEVASYLQIVLQVCRTPSISELTLALYEGRHKFLSPQSTLPLAEIASQCSLVRQRVKLICGGLLEFRDRQDLSIESEDQEIEWVNEETTSDQGESSSSTHQPNAFERANTVFRQNRTTRVHLIHRTAYDFLKENRDGKEFMKSNISSTFDVYGSYIEARLAQLVILARNEEFYHGPSSPKPAGSLSSETGIASLDPPESTASLSSRSSVALLPGPRPRDYGIRDKSGFKNDIDEIMRYAFFVEAETNKAGATLIEKIDKVVTMLDQQYLRQHSDTHWCTRWGLPQEKVGLSLRTRSEYSALLASSIQNVPNYPLDFLCFAAYHRLYLYVQDTVRTRLEPDDPDTMTVLLRFTMRRWVMASDCLELGTVLLRRGAKPNVSSCYEDYSVWTFFLTAMRVRAETMDPTAIEEQWASTARTFIESGADVNARIENIYRNPFTWIVSGDVGTELKRFESMSVHAEMSVLAFLQDAGDPLPGLAEIRKMCIARGALWASKSIRLYTRWGVLDLSERQSEDVDKLVFACSCQKNGRPVSLPLESLREILLRLHDKLRLKELEDEGMLE